MQKRIGIRKLGAFATDTAGQLDVLWHNGDTLGVDCAQVGVFEQTDQVSFAGLLQTQIKIQFLHSKDHSTEAFDK